MKPSDVYQLNAAGLAQALREEADDVRDEYRQALMQRSALELDRLIEQINYIRAESLRKHNSYVVDQALRNATVD